MKTNNNLGEIKNFSTIFKGTKQTFEDLQDVTDMKAGDVWCVAEAFTLNGKKYTCYTNVVWTENEWAVLGGPDYTQEELDEMGKDIRAIRLQRGMSQTELAAAAGITIANMSRIEAGKLSVGLDILKKIASALGVTLKMG